MSVADLFHAPPAPALPEQSGERWNWIVFLACLSLFTLLIGDGALLSEWVISAVLLVFFAFLFLSPVGKCLRFGLPSSCLFLMAGYGMLRCLWGQRILYDGLNAVLFWFTAALISLFASHLFAGREYALFFRKWLALFGSAVSLLDLLQQASRTDRYFWLIPSKFHTVSGPFAYWNNFAQFIELSLPVTLWLGVGRRRLEVSYILLSALQIGAVAASGSRAGTALVLLELIVVLALVSLRNRDRVFLLAAATTLILSAVLVYAAGVSRVSQKFLQRDQLAVRRNINRSSLAMIEQRPLLGWGLGTYVPVYRMFALYDDGTYVNRAHDDWLQWAAEGGIPFAALMAVVVVWSVRPATRSIWGLGLLAVSIHAVVDYPFARLGVCGWYFALLGVLQADSWRTKNPGVSPPSAYVLSQERKIART